ncbi:MAG: amidohydrolase [Microbacterium sp. SCN 70-27]|uniref:amidohydrolase n=1 Tax=unclassified Microbacterium TaxID=2609290 RepID=UPI000869ED09|nr:MULTISPECIES: amidohydrolase [unclassified Microbacterium]MBN9223706.1 amidohydrolase [Microbacterium sp.]ODT28898.1 MAG: amidohydrolase [Microbacterium sp. SCN 70-27]
MSIDLEALYIDLHRHPELSFQETRTAGVVTRELSALGLPFTEGLGKTGVATVIENGSGPVVWLRADMDGLPVEEQTGLAYASTARGTDPAGTDVPVMHACGHDMHVTAMLGALERLVETKDEWSGTVVAVFQPAEEYGAGAQAMIADGVLDALPKPDIVLGQHLTPLPAGTIGVRPGTQMAASDGLTVRLLGRGGHGSRPHATIDPIVMAAATVMRLQTIVSREIDPREMAVVTIGSIHAGLKNNIIPAEAKLELSLRYPDDDARADVLARVERIVRAEAQASGAVDEPVITTDHSLPPTINDADATARLTDAWDRAFGEGTVVDPGMFTGSEDVSWFAREAGVPLVYWFWGGLDPQRYADAVARGTVNEEIPTNHSPFFAPILHPTIERGVDALVVAAREFLA